MKILFIGGTGVISSACSDLCVKNGHELFMLNRGHTERPIPKETHLFHADIKDSETVQQLIQDHHFDSVVDWIAYTQEDVKRSLKQFTGKTEQYVFISSASAYAKPPQLPLLETHPLGNPFWEYSHNKVLCEEYLIELANTEQFPVTIVRPSHTYDRTKIPLQGGYTALNRMLVGKQVIVHGDGTSLWTLTHHQDFAIGFMGVLGKQEAVGEAYHITGDEVLTWDQIYDTMAQAAGTEARIIHVPSDVIHRFDKDWGVGLLGDKAYSMVLDNSKIRRFVPDLKTTIPFDQGAREIIDWYQAEPNRGRVDQKLNATMDELVSKFG